MLPPGTGKGASTGASPPRRATPPVAGSVRDPPLPPSAPPPQPPTTRPVPTTTGCREGRCPVVSNQPLHRTMQMMMPFICSYNRNKNEQMSPRISIGPEPVLTSMPRPRLQGIQTAPSLVLLLQSRSHLPRVCPGHCNEDRHRSAQAPSQKKYPHHLPDPHYFHIPPHAHLHDW